MIKRKTLTLMALALVLVLGLSVAPSTALDSNSSAVEVEGAVIPATEELRSFLDLTDKDSAFILATEDDLYIVLADETAKSGLATVKGREIRSGIIVASSVNYEDKSTEVSLKEVYNNGDKYAFKKVKVEAKHHRTSVIVDPDDDSGYTKQVSAGVLTNSKAKANLTQMAQVVGGEEEFGDVASKLKERMGSNSPYMTTFSFNETFWSSANSTVEGVVIPSSSFSKYADDLEKFGINSSFSSTLSSNVSKPVLYVVNSELSSSVDEKTLEITGSTTSLQESIKNASSCDNCLNSLVMFDMVTYTGATVDNSTVIVGISNEHQDSVSKKLKGKYKVKGENMEIGFENRSINLSLDSIFVVYDIERVGDIDASQEKVQKAENKADRVKTAVVSKFEEFSKPSITEVIAMSDDKSGMSFEDVQKAIEYWVNNEEVPGTNEKMKFEDLQKVIKMWVTK